MPVRALLVALLVLAAVPGVANAGLEAPSDRGCIDAGRSSDPCARFSPPNSPSDGYSETFTLSPDGRHAYYIVGGDATRRGRIRQRSSLYAVSIDPSGRMKQVACYSSVPTKGCTRVRSMDEVWDVVVSPDGRFVYVSGYASNGIAILKRNGSTGRLTQLPGRAGCLRGKPRRRAIERCRFLDRRIAMADSAVITPDGKLLYLGAVAFRRNLESGALTPATKTLRPADGQKGTGSHGLSGIGQFRFTPDSALAFVMRDDNLLAFRVDPATGKLTRVGTAVAAESFALAPDGRSVLVVLREQTNGGLPTTQNNTLQEFMIDAATGALTPRGAPLAFCAHPDGTPLKDCEAGFEPIAMTADGRRLLVTITQGIVAFTRDPETGALTHDSCAWYDKSEPRCIAYPPLLGDSFGLEVMSDGKGLVALIAGGLVGLRLT